MRMSGGGGGFGGMLGNMRGLNASGDRAATVDNLSDESIVGAAYDHKVVMRLLTYIAPYKRWAILAIISVTLYTGANVCIPLLVKLGIDDAIKSGNLTLLHWIGGAFLLVAVVHFVSNYLQFVYMPRVGQGILYSLRTKMFNHLQEMSPSFYHRTPVGRIMSRSQSDVLQLQETFELIVQSFSDLLSLFGIITLMMILDWQLALICLSITPPLFFILGYWQKFARHSFMRIRRAIAMVNGEYNQNITGIRVVQSLNRQDTNMAHFDELNSEHLNANMEASRYSGSLQPVVELLIGVAMGFGVVLAGGMMAKGGALELGVLVAFALWIQRFFEPIRQLTMQYSQLQRAMAAGVRIFEVLDLEPEVKDAPDAEELPQIQGEIRFENVHFHYVPGVDVLKDINLHIRPGENVAIVGSTGAGKSTMVTLIHRFADVTQGPHPGGRLRHSPRHPPFSSGPDEHGVAGAIPVFRHGGRQHPLQPRRRHRRRGYRSGQDRRRPRFHNEPGERLRYGSGRAGRQPQRGATAATQLCPRRRRRPAGHRAGRGHGQHRYSDRADDSAGPATGAGRAHLHRHRPPAFHGAQRRQDNRPRPGQPGGDGFSRRTAGPRRRLRASVRGKLRPAGRVGNRRRTRYPGTPLPGQAGSRRGINPCPAAGCCPPRPATEPTASQRSQFNSQEE